MPSKFLVHPSQSFDKPDDSIHKREKQVKCLQVTVKDKRVVDGRLLQ